jgi:hypothetical protein
MVTRVWTMPMIGLITYEFTERAFINAPASDAGGDDV